MQLYRSPPVFLQQIAIFHDIDQLPATFSLSLLQSGLRFQDLLCICEVDICEYAITCDEGKDHTHWVVVYGYDNDNIYLNDSGYQKDGKGRKVPNEIFANALWQFNGISVFITCGY